MGGVIKLSSVVLLLAAVGLVSVPYLWPRFEARCSRRIDRQAAGVDLIPVGGVRLENPTRVAIGPSGELWVAERFGKIRVLRLRASLAGFHVDAEEIIDSIQSIGNHDDDGSPRPDLPNRLITGLAVVESSGETVAYVASSDPRIDKPDIDSNSGVISRLRKVNGAWVREDVVRGLPRSKADHATNAVVVSADQERLYVLQGANTNAGAPSESFFGLPEYALSGALLEVQLDDLVTPFDLPTLDDEDRPGDPDANDPFGGASGKNQAVEQHDGPVRVYASGLRNPYAMVHTSMGFYVADNGANQNYGGEPEADELGYMTNAPREGGRDRSDSLYLVDRIGLQFGHANPTRSNPFILFNETDPQRPLPATVTQSDTPSASTDPLVSWDASTNGLAWVPDWQGEDSEGGFLVSIDLKGAIRRYALGANGRVQASDAQLRSHRMLLDAVASDPAGDFPNIIWTVDHGQGEVLAFDMAAADHGIIWRIARSLPQRTMEFSCSVAGVEIQ